MRAAQLRRLYMNYNKLRADGIPNAILRLSELTSLGLAGNQLVCYSLIGKWRRDRTLLTDYFPQSYHRWVAQDTIPRAVCLLKLRTLNLRDNALTTLPVEIHLLLDNATVCVTAETSVDFRPFRYL